jgi:hypothetical protein
MLVIISVAELSNGDLEVCVQRPQHSANASRIYQSRAHVKDALLSLGIAEHSLSESFQLLPQLGTGERLKFPPMDVPHHDLVTEGFNLGNSNSECP